jgi:hypothetical protein
MYMDGSVNMKQSAIWICSGVMVVSGGNMKKKRSLVMLCYANSCSVGIVLKL